MSPSSDGSRAIPLASRSRPAPRRPQSTPSSALPGSSRNGRASAGRFQARGWRCSAPWPATSPTLCGGWRRPSVSAPGSSCTPCKTRSSAPSPKTKGMCGSWPGSASSRRYRARSRSPGFSSPNPRPPREPGARPSAALRALLEGHGCESAGNALGGQPAETLPLGPLIEKAIPNESDQVLELPGGQLDRLRQEGIDPLQDGLDWPQPVGEVRSHAGGDGVVVGRGLEDVEMVSDRVFNAAESAVVTEGRLRRAP